jgi:hypothetical protein
MRRRLFFAITAGWHLIPTRRVADSFEDFRIAGRVIQGGKRRVFAMGQACARTGFRIAFKSYDDIVDHCCYAWNTLIDQPWKIMSIAMRRGYRRSLTMRILITRLKAGRDQLQVLCYVAGHPDVVVALAATTKGLSELGWGIDHPHCASRLCST